MLNIDFDNLLQQKKDESSLNDSTDSLIQMSRIVNSPMMNLQVDRIQNRKILHKNKELIDFQTCAYLSLENDIQNQDIEIVKKYGLRNGWSRISGTSTITKSLENQLEKCLKLDAVRLGQSISLINYTVFYGLSQLFDVALLDSDAHITIKQGVKAAFPGSLTKIWRNNNCDQLEKILRKYPAESKKLISIDGIYSMKGVEAPIAKLLKICEKYNCWLYIDDAHGFGAVGKNGYGVLDKFNIEKHLLNKVIYVGSFSKCASNPVAFIGANQQIINHLDNCAPFLIYCGPPSNLHTALCVRHLENFSSEKFSEKRNYIKHTSEYIHRKLSNVGISTMSHSGSPILAIRFLEKNYEEIVQFLFDKGISAKGAIYPVVRRGEAVMRFSITSGHIKKEIDCLISIVASKKELFLNEKNNSNRAI